jgi:hypothetical protein
MRVLWNTVLRVGLAAMGAVFGFLTAAVALVAWQVFTHHGSFLLPERAFFLLSAGLGAAAGALLGRIAAITAGLMAAGALFGGVSGAVALTGYAVAMDGPAIVWEDPVIIFFAAITGAALGAVLGPVAAWLLMRHVPLGLAFAGTALGTVAGAGVGMLLTSGPGIVLLGTSIIGFAASAVFLRFAVPRQGARLPAGVPNAAQS